MNSVCLIGNLTKAPELRDAGGTPVANLRLAVNGRKKQGDDWIDVANYFNVTLWGRQAELAAAHLEKGRQVAVQGRLQWHEWEAEDGSNRQSVEVVAESIDYLSKPKSSEPGDQPASEDPHNDAVYTQMVAVGEDDIPY